MADWRDERRVAQALRKHRPMSAADRRLAQYLVDRDDRRRWITLVYAGLALLALVLWGVLPGHPVWLPVLALVFAVVTVAWWWVRVRRTRVDGAAVGLVPRRLRAGAAPARSGTKKPARG